jgi:hypothetical protein
MFQYTQDLPAIACNAPPNKPPDIAPTTEAAAVALDAATMFNFIEWDLSYTVFDCVNDIFLAVE